MDKLIGAVSYSILFLFFSLSKFQFQNHLAVLQYSWSIVLRGLPVADVAGT